MYLVIVQLTDWLTDWLDDWLIAQLTCCLSYRLTSFRTSDQLTGWRAQLLTDWLYDRLGWWANGHRLIDWLIGWLIAWLICLTGWLTYWRFMLRKLINVNFLYDVNQNYWLLMKWLIFHFRWDVSSRCDKTLTATGFRGYLQCRKCCIYCFVIQLLSEPDKQNFWYSLFKVRLRRRFVSF